jgi:hypothetical protein
MRTLSCLALLAASTVGTTVLAANNPGVITFGEDRARIQSTPIEQRPYRPLHFYGNTVRRRNSRSTVRPTRSSSQQIRTTSQSRSTQATRARP